MFYIASIFKICNWSNTTVFHLWERKLVFSDIFGETTPYKLILFGSLPNARVYANAIAKKLHSTPFCCCVDWHFRLKTIQIWGNLLNDIIHYTRAYLNYCGDCVLFVLIDFWQFRHKPSAKYQREVFGYMACLEKLHQNAGNQTFSPNKYP